MNVHGQQHSSGGLGGQRHLGPHSLKGVSFSSAIVSYRGNLGLRSSHQEGVEYDYIILKCTHMGQCGAQDLH